MNSKYKVQYPKILSSIFSGNITLYLHKYMNDKPKTFLLLAAGFAASLANRGETHLARIHDDWVKATEEYDRAAEAFVGF